MYNLKKVIFFPFTGIVRPFLSGFVMNMSHVTIDMDELLLQMK